MVEVQDALVADGTVVAERRPREVTGVAVLHFRFDAGRDFCAFDRKQLVFSTHVLSGSFPRGAWVGHNLVEIDEVDDGRDRFQALPADERTCVDGERIVEEDQVVERAGLEEPEELGDVQPH